MQRFPTGANAWAKSAQLDIGGTRFLKSVTCYNANAGNMYLMIFDAAALPSNGTVPLMAARIPTTGTGSLDFGSVGLPYDNGMVAALSSTAESLTIAVADDGLFCGVTDYR